MATVGCAIVLTSTSDRIILSSGNVIISVKFDPFNLSSDPVVTRDEAPAWIRAAALSQDQRLLTIATNAKHVQVYKLDPFELVASV